MNANSDSRALLITMSELQSNAAYHPLYPSSDPCGGGAKILVQPYLMGTRTFWCAMRDSPLPFKISVHPDDDVDDLKRKIQKVTKEALDASKLVLWKVFFIIHFHFRCDS